LDLAAHLHLQLSLLEGRNRKLARILSGQRRNSWRRFLAPLLNLRVLNLKDLTIYKIIYSAVDERPEGADMLLKRMVGASGFEPPASWSRTRFESLLKSIDLC
jgi:hypothetical protein